MSYNERVQRREEEIESLQEALKILGAPRGSEPVAILVFRWPAIREFPGGRSLRTVNCVCFGLGSPAADHLFHESARRRSGLHAHQDSGGR